MPVAPADLSALPEPGLLIGGNKLLETRLVHEHRYAATGEVTCRVPLAGAAEIDAAVKSARSALPGWRGMAANERRRLMLNFAQLIRDNKEALVRLAVVENSVPRATSQVLPGLSAEYFEYYAGWTDKIRGEVVTTWPAPAFDCTLDEPYGVIGIIVPWNGPIVSFGQVSAPALAGGNCVVIKPPELAPFSCLRLGELAIEAGIPPGVINVVPAGVDGGEALTRHPGIDKLHFTGSGPTARKILAGALTNLTPVGLSWAANRPASSSRMRTARQPSGTASGRR